MRSERRRTEWILVTMSELNLAPTGSGVPSFAAPRFRPIRIGVLRDGGSQFRRIANLGLSADGGVWVSPAALPGVSWNYGNQAPNPSRPQFYHSPDAATTAHNVKLHYHRSGAVYPTLSGTDLERRSAYFPGLLEHPRTQIMSLTAGRTWEYPLVRPKKGDAIWVVQRWPDWFIASFAVHLIPPGSSVRTVRTVNKGAAGLLDGDSERYVVDLSGHGIPGVLSIRLGSADESELPQPLGVEPTFSMAAFSWSETSRPREVFALWSRNMTNPAIPIESALDLAPIDHFVGSPRTLADDLDDVGPVRTVDHTGHAGEAGV